MNDRALFAGIPDDPRITADIEEPVTAFRCDYTGHAVGVGEDYYTDGEIRVCESCAKRYAWMDFLTRFDKKTADRNI
jgi:hypothetical protein